jgi:ribose-phosphate pyrophosphokinase
LLTVEFFKEHTDASIKIPAKRIVFSGGEVHTELPNIPSEIRSNVHVVARLQSSDDVVELINVTEILSRLVPPRYSKFLTIPYLPYGRQDRVTHAGTAFSLKTFARLINSLNYTKVTTYDVHSDVSPALIENLVNIPVVGLLGDFQSFEALACGPSHTLVAPDAGAYKRLHDVSTQLKWKRFECATKFRDVNTGRVQVKGFPDGFFKGESVTIVDDICDGGATFVELAIRLRVAGAKEVNLYVTHGIFSKGLEPLLPHIDNIFCTDSFMSPTVIGGSDRLHVKAL